MTLSARSLRLLFCSYHSYVDPSSGAALSTRELFEMLAAHGWQCAVLSGPQLDFEHAVTLESLLRAEKLPFRVRPGIIQNADCTLYHCLVNGVPLHAFVPADTQPQQPPSAAAEEAFLALFAQVCTRFQPDLLLTYGGQKVMHQIIHHAKQQGVKVVFALHNFEYTGSDLFREVDAITVPSRATQQHYQETLGLDSTVLKEPMNWQRFLCPEVRGRYVTFVNPQPSKGAFWVGRIAYELHERRPDIPFLIVEGRGGVHWLTRSDLDLSGLTNLHRMANTPDPRQFYALSRIVLMPSLWPEAFGRVAAEACSNGIPVLSSRRGGLPDTLAEAGFLFDIAETYTAQSRHAPSAAEVAPWIEVIERLWDDPAFYAAESAKCRRAAEAWRPERSRQAHEEFFRRVLASSV